MSRDEIAKRLWPQDVYVDVDAGIHTAVLRVRRVLGDTRESPRFVETVPGKGYRFNAPVKHVYPSAPERATQTPPAQRSSMARRRNLPSELTSFIGRLRELEDLHQLSATSRLLSLIGAGGVGKTRLAVRLASDVADEFPDGVSLIDLAPLTASDLILETIAAKDWCSRECAAIRAEELDDPRGIAYSLDLYTSLLAARGYADAAARLWGASDGLLATVGGSLVPTMHWIRARYFQLVKASLGESFQSISAEGRAMPTDDAIVLARQQGHLLSNSSTGNLSLRKS